ncbi:MAG: HAMP domain-containing protein [Cyanobacteria bacterium]|nr:HAMP domain-containing protein [Cyanobacteriota bacterium]
MRPLPLRTTLTLLYAVVLSVILTAVGWAYHAALKRQLDNSVTADLEGRARALHGYLRFDHHRVALAYDAGDADEAAFIVDATRYYQVYDAATGQLLHQSPGLEALGLKYTRTEVGEFRGAAGIRDVQTDRGRLRLDSTVITTPDGGVYLVQVGTLLDRLDASLSEFDRVLAIRTAFGVIIAALIGFAFSGLALGPLRRLTGEATAIDIANLQARLPVRGAGDELDQLALAFNDALARLERSVNEMRQFSAALAHELRTPLAVLRGEAELAIAASAPAERERLASQIDEYDRLTRLINQILMLARAEAGELSMQPSRVDLSGLAAHVAEQVEPLADAKEIALVRAIDPGVHATVDAGWIERLLLILIDNAIKFTPPGGRVTIAVAGAGSGVILEVADTGIGIAADAWPQIFDPFYRGDATHSRRSDGAGIGLALAKWIADRHGAAIGVTSAPDNGSTFTVRFPPGD